MKFFSTAEKLALGGMPFLVADDKPTRRDGLAYYRAIVRHFGIDVRQYERGDVGSSGASADGIVHSESLEGERQRTTARAVVRRDGLLRLAEPARRAGRDRCRTSRTSTARGTSAFDQDVVVVGGGNSAAEAALDLWRAGARVTLVHFGPTFDKKIKPWVLPDFENRDEGGRDRGAVGQPRRRRSSRVR